MNQVIQLSSARPGHILLKSPASAPNLSALRDACCGMCWSWTARRHAVLEGTAFQELLQRAISTAVRRNVDRVTDVAVRTSANGWTVTFATVDGDADYSYSFNIPARWLNPETLGEHRA